MTWLDIVFIVLLIVFLGMGAKMGSLWTAACLIGGFFGSFLVDYYALPLSGMMGNFAGSDLIAGIVLFVAGVAAVVIPGLLLSRFFSAIFLGFADSAFGLLTGMFAGLCTVTVLFLIVIPMFPQIEASRAWKKSRLVRPAHERIESLFSKPHFQKSFFAEKLPTKALDKVAPLAEQAADKIKDAAEDAIDKIKK